MRAQDRDIEQELLRRFTAEYDEPVVGSASPLDVFLYILMRDHLTSGKIEQIMEHVAETKCKPVAFTNEHLAAYAKDLRERIMDDDTGTEESDRGVAR